MQGHEQNRNSDATPEAALRKPWAAPAIVVARELADSEVKGGNIGDYTTYGTPEGS